MDKEPLSKKDVIIIRQTCVKASCELFAQKSVTAETVIQYAQLFESYVHNGEIKPIVTQKTIDIKLEDTI
jgi:hypothetical protein